MKINKQELQNLSKLKDQGFIKEADFKQINQETEVDYIQCSNKTQFMVKLDKETCLIFDLNGSN